MLGVRQANGATVLTYRVPTAIASLFYLLLVFLFGGPAGAQEGADDQPWYPRTLTSDKGSAVIHAPQIDAWHEFETITAWVAFEITRAGDDRTFVGSLNFTAQTDTDIAAREVLIHDVEIDAMSIRGLDKTAVEYELIRDGFTAMSRKLPLDLVLEYLPEDMPVSGESGLGVEPPAIFVSETPAILVTVDAEPVILPVEGTELRFVLNTPWDILQAGEGGPFLLCLEGTWLTAPALDAAEWTWARELPAELSALPATRNWDRVRDCLPETLARPPVPDTPPPGVFYSTSPAELLLFTGKPDWQGIGQGGLLYAANTEQELFRVGGNYYLLLSGRWFRAVSLDGPWTIERSLPDAFQTIPDGENQPKSYVRASVPGTREASEAALVASIPRKAAIQRGSEDALDLEVSYAGEPQFVPIEDTGIEMAINTSFQVLRYEGVYYLCHNATWLTAFSAEGPWTFADSIPDAFATIPPSSPAYNTTFVKIENADSDNVYYAYKPGYEQAYVTEEETVVYGSGYDNSAITIAIAYGFYSGGYGYPYYWWPPTYGYGSWYDPGTGRYGEAIVGYGPYGAAGSAAVYNPETGVYGRGRGVWDSDEFAGRGYVYNPNTNTSIARNRYIDFEDNEGWSQRVARRGDEWRYTESEWQDGRMRTDFESSRGTEGTFYRERQGDSVVSEGTISRGGESATFESTREREGDAIVSEGSITGDDRSASFESARSDGQLAGNIEGSEGGSGSFDRQLEDGEITGGGTFTKDGRTIETDVTRDAEGVTREFESSSGGQGVSRRSGEDSGFVYESGTGDMYAGRDGNVYRKTEDGWSEVQNPRTGSAGTTSTERNADRSAARERSQQSYDYSRNLERDYQSRQRGYERYDRHRASGGQMPRNRAEFQRRRRR